MSLSDFEESRTVYEIGYADFFGETRKCWRIGATGEDEYSATIAEGIGFVTGGIINYHFVCTVDPYFIYPLCKTKRMERFLF